MTPMTPTSPTPYTVDDAIRAAVQRAARDTAGAFVVYVDRAGIIYMCDSKASPPPDSRIEAVAQFFSCTHPTDPNAPITIQIHRSRGESEFVHV